MQGPSSSAPLAHTTLLLVVSAGRTPTVSASTARPGETRLELAAAGAAYGASVVLVGPAEILGVVVADLGAALRADGGAPR
jgi:hypothetical protein